MSFTDDDLNQLKETLSWADTAESVYSLRFDRFDALLARLEAAEYLNQAYKHGTHKEIEMAKELWRKAAGK